jgi:hypothetical protein
VTVFSYNVYMHALIYENNQVMKILVEIVVLLIFISSSYKASLKPYILGCVASILKARMICLSWWVITFFFFERSR